MPNEPRAPRLAVLIDADNASARIAPGLFEEIAKIGEASVRRIYGDFSGTRLKAWADILSTHAIMPHQNFAYTSGKNASDIALVIDAMDLLHSGRFDGFCLVSSDSDFTRLAARIREQGVDVYGFGEQKTPESFRQACRRFIYTENLLPEAPAPDEPERPDARPVSMPEEARAAWLGLAVARTLEASCNLPGPRACAFHDHLGRLLGIDIAKWWRPTGANYFDRVPKVVTLGALQEVGGPAFAARYAKAKKAELAESAQRIFAGDFIGEVEVKEAALAWVPEVMRFRPAIVAAASADETPPWEDEPADQPGSGSDSAAVPDEPRESGDGLEQTPHVEHEEVEEAA